MNCLTWTWLIVWRKMSSLMQEFALDIMQVFFCKNCDEEKEIQFFNQETYINRERNNCQTKIYSSHAIAQYSALIHALQFFSPRTYVILITQHLGKSSFTQLQHKRKKETKKCSA